MPPENILALFNTAKEYGVYPIDKKRIDDKLKKLSKIKPVIKQEIIV